MNNTLDLLYELVRTGFKLRYNNSILGFLWVLLKPFMFFAILYVVFSQFETPETKNYAIYLLIGMTLYNFFSEAIIFGMNSLIDKVHIVLKVNFSREIGLLSSIVLAVINFAINLLILAIFLCFSPVNLQIMPLIYFLFISLTLVLLVYEISLFTSIIRLKLHDLHNIVEILLQLGFYLTPIIIPITFLPEKLASLPWLSPRGLVEINPLTILIQAARDALILGEVTHLFPVSVVFALICLFLPIGRIYFQRNIPRVAEFF